jgi:hypothetical protein
MVFASLMMSFMILCMRVHYSYDVMGAYFFTTLIYFAPIWLRNYFFVEKLVSESGE